MVSWHQKQRPQSLLLTITNAGKAILVPLTASLYVPGALADTDKVIVDIGTGFFVERVRLLTWVELLLIYVLEYKGCYGFITGKLKSSQVT
jgi:hypothetical protein